MMFTKLLFIFFHFIFRCVAGILNPIFHFLYNSKNCMVPAVKNPILLKSATELARLIRARKVTSEEVVKAFISRIDEINPLLNMVVANRFDEALEAARGVDAILLENQGDAIADKFSEINKPFLGVPITTKEAISIKGLPNTSGLLYRKDVKSTKNADCIEILTRAGCIPLAITNVSELCMWYESANMVYGRTSNAYHQGRMVGGSSGGEGCIQSAAASPLGIGSDIGGSIRMPCFFNGIFGHKPSTGIVSNEGQFPNAIKEASTFLGTGPMSRYSCDLMPVLKLLVKPEARTLLKLDDEVDIRKLKFYYMEDDGGQWLTSPVHPEIKEAVVKAANHFRSLGCRMEKVSIKLLRQSFQIWATKMRVSGNIPFCELMGNLSQEVNPFKEMLYWLVGRPKHTLPSIILGIMEKIRGSPESEKKFCENCHNLQLEFKSLLGDDGIFLYPTHPLPAPYHNQPLILCFNFSYTAIFNVLGLPATAIPMGLAKEEGVPIGIQAVASTYNDHLTIAVAEELERVFGGWVPPFNNSI